MEDFLNGSNAKKKVFFVLASLTSGGSQRVFWNLAQGFDKNLFDVSVVLLTTQSNCFSLDIDQVKFIDLDTPKASKSFIRLYKLLKSEKPFAVFSTSAHINILVSLVAVFLNIPRLIARASNIPQEQQLFEGLKSKFYLLFTRLSYKVYQQIVCQTEEMKQALKHHYGIAENKMVVISNPVKYSKLLCNPPISNEDFKLIAVARLSPEKGLERLLDIMALLPDGYQLSLVGVGKLRNSLQAKVALLGLQNRVAFLGEVKDVQPLLAQHHLMVITSFTEGFPNVVLEALSVGLPVVAFKVSGVAGLVQDGFNGYVLPQGDIIGFRDKIVTSCTKDNWDYVAVKEWVYKNHSLSQISRYYEQLIH